MFELISIFVEEYDDQWHLEESVTENEIFMFIVSGQVIYRLNGQSIVLNKGDLLYIPAGTTRETIAEQGLTHKKYVILFHMLPESRSSIALLSKNQYQVVHTRSYEYTRQRFSYLLEQWIGMLPHYDTICQGIGLELLGMFERDSEMDNFPPKKLSLVTTIQQYVLAHYKEQIRIEELAVLVDRTPNYVSRIFREITGLTPIEYLHQVRITVAKDLLLHSQLTIGQVADALGYCDQSYFNRVYKKWTGYPPSCLIKERSH